MQFWTFLQKNHSWAWVLCVQVFFDLIEPVGESEVYTRRMTVSFGVNELNHKHSAEERMLMTTTMGLMMFMAMMTRRCRTVPFGVNRLNRECSSYTSVSNSLWILSAFPYTMQKKKSWLNVLDILKWNLSYTYWIIILQYLLHLKNRWTMTDQEIYWRSS